jgi:hypothetical protein
MAIEQCIWFSCNSQEYQNTEQIMLYESMLNGSHDGIDLSFQIDGELLLS